MSRSSVRRDGVHGERPGRQAPGGQGTATTAPLARGRRRGRGGEELMVPGAEFTSYYGRPIIKRPTWRARDIAGYFFLGGLAGAGSVVAAGAGATGRPVMARALKVSSLAAVTGSAAALVHDLGRPARFAHMLRVLRPTSPMSVGSWLLSAYGPAAGAAAVLDLTGRLPRLGRAATGSAALLGSAVAAYTAVLAADTAVPAWHDGYRELPFVFTGSATLAASGMALLASPVGENAPAVAGALLGTAVETAAVVTMERRLGMIAEPYRHGRGGRLMRAATALSAAGAAGAVLRARRSRSAAALSGALLLAASACTRFGVFHAGVASADDPKYTVLPQRERLRRRAEEAAAASTAE
ncbi:putative polysulphide reductase [Actinacidiphila reveromycinica]|uniref:Putative polysulphide reductase n=1 Tax=Actinacidiphila reveromycinica TaxID=659352 RepID=A0A7U3UMZ7_9ACTN|nr:NrfD/PsrC family molybdoenzyme membrane anchor subunit [Streptomyces sp. SN-593]BBA95523.1 putative polysulphide reductase [Streptomyces sp. SN-593]